MARALGYNARISALSVSVEARNDPFADVCISAGGLACLALIPLSLHFKGVTRVAMLSALSVFIAYSAFELSVHVYIVLMASWS